MFTFHRLGFAFAIVVLLISSVSARDPKEALLEETRLEYIRTPMVDILSFLSDMHDVQIAIDVRTDVVQAITLRKTTGPLGELLTKILTPLGLKYRTDAHAITVEPIDRSAYVLELWEKRNKKRKALGRSPLPKPRQAASPRPNK